MKAGLSSALASTEGPYVSVYLQDTRDGADGTTRFETQWQGIRRRLHDDHVPGEVVDQIEAALVATPPAGGRLHAVIASPHGVVIDERVDGTLPEPVLRISDYPYVLPLAAAELAHPAYVFAAVDHRGAELTIHGDGDAWTEEVDGGNHPIHKPASAGWNGYGDFAKTAEEAIRKNIRKVADRLTELVDQTGAVVVFVCGEVRARSEVLAALPDRIAIHVTCLPAGAYGHRATEAEVRDTVDEEFRRRRVAHVRSVVELYRAEKGRRSGLAVDGLGEVCAALRSGTLDTLIVSGLHDTTVLSGSDLGAVAPDADVLSELGEFPARVARADEALPFAAVRQGASVIAVDDDLGARDGVAALLRYPQTIEPPSSTAPAVSTH